MKNKNIKIRPPSNDINLKLKEKLNSDNNDPIKNSQLKSNDFNVISNSIEKKIKNNESILDLFPDIELSIQILISSILSPKDLTTVNLMFKSENSLISSDIRNTLLSNLKKYINLEYKLTDKLPSILRESLFTKGSFIETYIPEASVDDVINGPSENIGLESFINEIDVNKNLFNTNDSTNIDYTTTEEKINKDFKADEYITFSDNVQILNSKNIYREIKSKETRKQLHIGLEGHDDYKKTYEKNVNTMLKNIFKPTSVHKNSEVVTINSNKENKRESVGKPLKMKLPVESVIPIHMPGEPSDHIGYFILINEKGVPITTNDSWNASDLDELLSINNNNIIDKAKIALRGITEKVPTVNDIENIYSSIIDKKIINAVKDSNIGDIGEILDTSHIYKVMTARVLKKQKTRMLYLPSEVVSFYAFNFRANGTGESLLEKISMLASIRAMLLFARLMANIKNSIPNTNVSASLDPKDPDPKKTMDIIRTEAMKSRQLQLPFGVTNIDDLVLWSQKVGFSFQFNNHPGIPEMEINTESVNTDIKEPEDVLEESIKKHMIMSFGLTPEIVDNGFSGDFATTILANNALLTKRVMLLQNQFAPQVTNNIKIIVDNDDKIRKDLKNTITENMNDIKSNLSSEMKVNLKTSGVGDDYIVEWFLDDFIKNLTIELPQPENYDENGLRDAFDEYKSAIEDQIELFLSEDALPEELSGSELSSKVDAFKTATSTTLLRKWMSDNNYLPDLQNVLTKDKDGNPILNVMDEYQNYLENLTDAVKNTLTKNTKTKKKLDKVIIKDGEKYESEEEEENTNEKESDTGEEETPNVNDDESGDKKEEETPNVNDDESGDKKEEENTDDDWDN